RYGNDGTEYGLRNVTMNMLSKTLSILAIALATGAANAAAIKIATVAPDGTAWMKEMRATGDAIKTKTEGRVEMKFYPGGVMGDDATVLRKMKIGQLQGGLSPAAKRRSSPRMRRSTACRSCSAAR